MPEIVTFKEAKMSFKNGITVFIKGVPEETILQAKSMIQAGMGGNANSYFIYSHDKIICSKGITGLEGLTEKGKPVEYKTLTNSVIDSCGGRKFLRTISERIEELSVLKPFEKN